MIVRNRSNSIWFCAALALLLGFFSIAVYSPLHVHPNGDAKQCSLNNVEHQVADSTAPVLTLPAPILELAPVYEFLTPAIPSEPQFHTATRGPPAPESTTASI